LISSVVIDLFSVQLDKYFAVINRSDIYGHWLRCRQGVWFASFKTERTGVANALDFFGVTENFAVRQRDISVTALIADCINLVVDSYNCNCPVTDFKTPCLA